MVKADLAKDYYADLELTSTATENEVKKQFRQLALKYHPDRNPGRETEVNAKFQTIQYAYEVLTDAEQKARYDQGRARAGRGGGSAFSQQGRPSSGFAKGNPWANAGSNFPPPPSRTNPRTRAHPPPPPPPSAGASRYSNFAGFPSNGFPPSRAKQTDDAETRRKTYEAFSGMRGGGTRTGASSQYAPPPFAGTQAPPPPKPAPPPIPKRNGYAPNNAGGDEPPAANTSAYSNRRRAPTAKQEPPPAPPKNNPNADPLRQFKDQAGAPFEPRVSTPYASSGGEKFNPFESANIGRSNTTRADSRSSGSFGRSTRNRHRSVSPIRDFKNEPQFDDSNRTASDANISNTSPKRPFSKKYNTSNNLGGQARTTPIIDLTSSDESSPEARKYAKPRTRRAQDTSTPAKPTPQASYMPNPAADTPGAAPKTDPRKIFSFSVDGQQYTAHSTPKPFTSASAENINTTFTPEHWEGKFEAGAAYFDGTPTRGNSATSSRPQSRPHVDMNAGFSSINPEASRQSKSADEAASSPGAAKFSADEWAQTFKEPTFFAAPTPGGQKGYPRSGTARRAKHVSASAKSTSGRSSKTASADDDDSDRPLYMGSRPVSKEGPNRSAQPAFANSPNAMDVDDTPAERPARNVHAAPSRTEWRTGEPGFTSAEPSPSKPPQHQHIEVNEPDLAANFNDLKNTEPFTNPAAGLNSFADLKTDFPFQSKASSNIPFPKRFNSKDLFLPQPPKGPSPPSVSHNAARPAADDWNEYLRKMLIYIKEWSDFNGQMVGHFAARRAQVDGFRQNWLLAMGDGELEVYMDGLKEDEKVRAWWDIAIGKHTKAMEDFVWAKKVFRDGVQDAGRRSEDGGVRIPQSSERLLAEINA